MEKPTYEELEKIVAELEKALKNKELDREELRAGNERYRAIFEHSPAAIAISTLEGELISVNRAALEITGYALEELLGRKATLFYCNPQDRPALLEQLSRDGYVRNYELSFKHKDGSVFTGRLNMTTVKFGSETCLLSMLKDVTALERSLGELKASEQRFHYIIKHNPSTIAVLDRELRFIMVSDTFLDQYSIAGQEVIGRYYYDILPKIPQRIKDVYQKALQGSVESREEDLFLRLDGTFGYSRWQCRPWFEEEGRIGGIIIYSEVITERKLAEEALYEKQALTQILLDNLNSVVVVKDARGRYLLANRKAARVIGKSVEEIIGKTPFDLYPREIAESIHADDMKVLESGRLLITEERLSLDDGRVYFTTKVPVLDRDGRTRGLCGLATDITERKRAEQALRESEARLQAIFSNAAIGIVLCDSGGRILQANRHFLEMLGYDSQEEILNKSALELTHPEDREHSRRALKDMAAGAIDSFNIEKRYLRRDGSIFWGNISVSVIRNRDGSVLAQIGMIVDISVRKLTEQALRESEEHFRALAENVTDVILRLDRDMRCLYINPAITRFTGNDPGYYLGRTIREFGLPDKTRLFWEKQLRKVLELGEPVESIYELELNAEKLLFDWRLIPEFDAEGRIETLLSTSRDITAIRQLEEERAKLSKLESVGVLAGGIAHDFNNILTAVLGNISLVRMLNGGERIEEYLEDAEKAALRAKDLTRQLLTFSRGGQPVKKMCEIGRMLKESTEFAIRGSNVKSEYFLAEDLWLVEADEGQISQVINNLVINAHQAMPEGGIIRIHAENTVLRPYQVPALEEGRYVKIIIRDSGIGISRELLPKIFDPYFTTKQTGSGLGLTTSFSIIKKHDGHIIVESTLGAGTSIIVYLPAAETLPLEKEKPRPAAAQPAARILVMDDEPVVLEVASKMLALIGHQVEVAEEGGLAVEMYKNAGSSGCPFDVVILDLTIRGGMGGREALEKMIEFDPGVKAIVSSGYSNDPVLSDFKKYGFRGMVSKPYRIDELKQILGRVIEG